MTLSNRKQYAKKILMEIGLGYRNPCDTTRGYDNCFEMNNGGEVVRYLMNKAKTDSTLNEGIKACGTYDYWQYFCENGSYQGFKN